MESQTNVERGIRQKCIRLTGFAVLAVLACQAGVAYAQATRGPTGSFVRPAPSAWPVYQAARSQGAYGSVPLYPPASYGQVYPRVQGSLDNPWYSAPYQDLRHHSGAYPYSESFTYPYSRSYLYPYNYLDPTTVPSVDTTGSGSGREFTDFEQPRPRRRLPEPPPPVEAAPATVEVRVPTAQAEVTFQGQRTTTKGTRRIYKTPDLAPGRSYIYEVTARWNAEGDEVSENRTVRVTPGGHVVIDFTTP